MALSKNEINDKFKNAKLGFNTWRKTTLQHRKSILRKYKKLLESNVNVIAEIINEAEEVFDKSNLIIKVKEPIEQELGYLREDLTLFTYLHLAGNPESAKKIVNTGVTGIAYETVTDENNDLPLLAPMSEIAGQISIVVGSYNLLKHNHGKGVLLGSFKDLDARVVTVIGGGVAGTQAIENAINNKALVNVIDLSVDTLNSLKVKFGEDNVNYIQSSPDAIVECIKESDLVVGSVYVIGKEE